MTGEMEKVREKGATSGAGVLATFGYDDRGRRTSLTRGNGASTTYSYDAVSRLGSMTHDFGGSATTHDLTLGFAYNPASQIVEATRSNDLYAWTGHGSGTTSSTTNGLNQLATHAGATATSDAKGNLTSDGTYTYAYSSENLLTSFGATGTLEYDPLMRFYRNYSTYFIHEGGQLVGDYYNGNIVSRYVPGAAGDEPVAQIDKFGDRTGFHADERGSIVAGSNSTGANARIVTYDEYGKRGPGGSYRFAYTGQVHLLNDIYDYKARNYNAQLGRFLQTDRIGYGDGMNMYGYVGGDPVNFTDPSGRCAKGEHKVYDTGSRIGRCVMDGSGDNGGLANGYSGFSTAGVGGRSSGHFEKVNSGGPASTGSNGDIVVTSSFIWVPDNWVSGLMPIPGTPLPKPKETPKEPDFCGSDEADLPEGLWSQACKKHDKCYSTTSSKDKCDRNFIADIVADCSGRIFIPAICLAPAIVGGTIVTFFGHKAYNRARARRSR